VEKVAEFTASLGNVERVDVLPFHQMGKFKWERLGMDYLLRDARPSSREKVEEAVSRFRQKGLKAY
jgi:pyruvate formate lyase activating enzyme